MLDPLDPKFAQIGAAFINEYVREFDGTDHVYNCDLFNELTPDNSTAAYIKESGAAVYQAMLQSDPKAVWMMQVGGVGMVGLEHIYDHHKLQGWLFNSDFWTEERAQALLESVEIGSMIVLDLDSTHDEHYTRLNSYFGQPFIYNDLNNFGGQIGINGRIEKIQKQIIEARTM